MNDSVQTFFENMLELLPCTNEAYYNSVRKNDGVLETVVIEDVFMPEILRLLSDNSEEEKLRVIFEYIERVVTEDIHLREVLSITMMEILGNDKSILKVARQYLGTNSLKLQVDADRELGRMD